jgi:murein DD-endopeptidase MepM/ murein hydrolase activator NlpD
LGDPGRRSLGLDIAVPADTVVRAAASGTVAYAGTGLKGFGTVVFIRHDDGWVTAYAFNRKSLIRRGDQVRQGRPIAIVGRIADASFPRLRFEIRRGSEALDPLDYLPKRQDAARRRS